MSIIDDVAAKLIAFGHGFPHLTMNLKPLEQPIVFDTNSELYVESVLVIGFLPLLILLLLMVALMVYYCVIKFSADESAPKKRCCSVNICCYTTSGVFIICLSLLGLAGALLLCSPAFETINNSLDKLDPAKYQNQVNQAPNSHAQIKQNLIQYGNDISDELSNDQRALDEWVSLSKEFRDFSPSSFPDHSMGISMTKTTSYLRMIEQYRLWVSVALFSFYSLLVILSLIAICCKSKCMMLSITCALFFALAICHLTLYVQLAIGVGLSDYCNDPKAAQKSFIELPQCESSMVALNEFENVVSGMERIMGELAAVVNQDTFTAMAQDLASLKTVVGEIKVVKQCDFINDEAANITTALCGPYIVGWWSVLAASLVISVFIAQLLFFAPCVWRSFDHADDSFSSYDETTPFVRGQTFARPVYPQRQSVTLSFLRHESSEALDVGQDRQPPPYSSFR